MVKNKFIVKCTKLNEMRMKCHISSAYVLICIKLIVTECFFPIQYRDVAADVEVETEQGYNRENLFFNFFEWNFNGIELDYGKFLYFI